MLAGSSLNRPSTPARQVLGEPPWRIVHRVDEDRDPNDLSPSISSPRMPRPRVCNVLDRVGSGAFGRDVGFADELADVAMRLNKRSGRRRTSRAETGIRMWEQFGNVPQVSMIEARK